MDGWLTNLNACGIIWQGVTRSRFKEVFSSLFLGHWRILKKLEKFKKSKTNFPENFV